MDDEEIEVNAIVEEEEVATEAQVDALKGDKGDTGPQGIQGEPGYTPVKGVDYFTEQDKQELLSGVEAEIDELDRTKADITDIPDVSNFITKEVNNLTYYTLKTATGSLIDLEINQSTYVVTLSLKDIDGNVISTDTIDLPLESVVIGGTFDSVNKKIVLTLENGNTVDIPVGDLVAGLQTEITSSNKLASDLVDDTNSGNKFVTTSEKTAWNAKLDQSDLADYVKKDTYASSSKGGVFKWSNVYATAMQDGYLKTQVKTYENYGTANNEMFISKGTLENVITGKQLINQTTLDDSQAEQDAEVQALQDKVDLLESLIPTDTATGESLTLSNTAKYPFKEFNVGGNTKQATAILPDEYQQVDYIESSGTQYIDTGIATSNNMNVEAKAISTFGLTNGALNYSACLFGARKSVSNSSFFYNSGINNDFLGTGSTYLQIRKNTSSSMLNIENSNNSVKIVGGTYTYTNDEININITAPLNIYIFARNEDGTVGNNGTYKLYSFKMYENNSLVRNFVPCYRKSDNVVGLYDLVNNVFYTNAGTGSFTYGAVVTIPNPDFPIPVENVSGEVEVKIENKNLCKNELINKDSPALSTLYESYTGPITIAVKTTSGTAQVNYRLVYEDGTVYNNYVMTANQANDVWRIAKYTASKPIKRIGLYYISAGGTARVPEHIMFLKGTYNTITDADYEPHEEQTATLSLPEGMEMCKIGTYQDSFVYQGGKWYKNKKVRKYVFNGTESWSKNSGFTDVNVYYVAKPQNLTSQSTNLKCNYTSTFLATGSSQADYHDAIWVGSYINIKDNESTTLDIFKSKLQATNLVLYYVLTTPALEEITDPTLISDLESLKNLYSYKGTTYISSSNEPSPVFEVVYRKSLG